MVSSTYPGAHNGCVQGHITAVPRQLRQNRTQVQARGDGQAEGEDSLT